MTLDFRLARDADRPAIAALQTASWATAYAPYMTAEARDSLPQHFGTKWRDHASGPGDLVAVAVSGSEVVGVAAFLEADPMYLDNLHVRPDLKGQQIGRRLLAFCADRLIDRGVARAELTVIEDNHAARHFYERMGGQIVAREKDDVMGSPVDVLRLRWDDIAVWRRLAAA